MSDIDFSLIPHELLLLWLAVGAVLLVAELMTGSGWLLWPAGSAAATGVITGFVALTLTEQAATFAVLTVVSTIAGRRWIGRTARGGQDPNEPMSRLIGCKGEAACAFQGGLGRVFVDGKEWAAELEGEGALEAGGRVEVVELIGGARLRVRPA